MNTENIERANITAEQLQMDMKTNVEPSLQYKRVLLTEDAEEKAQPVDFCRVQHGHGPCACCGPYSE